MNSNGNDSDSGHFSDVKESELQLSFSGKNRQGFDSSESLNQDNRVHTSVLSLLGSSRNKTFDRSFLPEDAIERSPAQLETEIRKIMRDPFETPNKKIKKEAQQTGARRSSGIKLQKNWVQPQNSRKHRFERDMVQFQTNFQENRSNDSMSRPSESGNDYQPLAGRSRQDEESARHSGPHYYPGMQPDIMNDQYEQRFVSQPYYQHSEPVYNPQMMPPNGFGYNYPNPFPQRLNPEDPFNRIYPPHTNNQYYWPPPQQSNFVNPEIAGNPNYGPNFKEMSENQFYNGQQIQGPQIDSDYVTYRAPFQNSADTYHQPQGGFNPPLQVAYMANNSQNIYPNHNHRMYPMQTPQMNYINPNFKPQPPIREAKTSYYSGYNINVLPQETSQRHSKFRDHQRPSDKRSRKQDREYNQYHKHKRGSKLHQVSNEPQDLHHNQDLHHALDSHTNKIDKQEDNSLKKFEIYNSTRENFQTRHIENSGNEPFKFEDKKIGAEMQTFLVDKLANQTIQAENLTDNLEQQGKNKSNFGELFANTTKKPKDNDAPKTLRKLSRSTPFKITHHKLEPDAHLQLIEETIPAIGNSYLTVDQPLTTNEAQVGTATSSHKSFELFPIQTLEDDFERFPEGEENPSVNYQIPEQQAQLGRFSPSQMENEPLNIPAQQMETEDYPIFPQKTVLGANPHYQSEIHGAEEFPQPIFESFSMPFPNSYVSESASLPMNPSSHPNAFLNRDVPKFDFSSNIPVINKTPFYFPNFQGQQNETINKNTFYQNNNVHQQQPQSNELSDYDVLIQQILDMGRQQRPETYEELKRVLRDVPKKI